MSTSGKMCMFKQPCQYNRITQASALFSPDFLTNYWRSVVSISAGQNDHFIFCPVISFPVWIRFLGGSLASRVEFHPFNQTHPQLTSYNIIQGSLSCCLILIFDSVTCRTAVFEDNKLRLFITCWHLHQPKTLNEHAHIIQPDKQQILFETGRH